MRRIVQTHANSLALVRFDRNDYSVPTSQAHRPVTAIGSIDEVRLAASDQVVARHQRLRGKEDVVFDPIHYLALLERKPGAFASAKPLENWQGVRPALQEPLSGGMRMMPLHHCVCF